MPRALDLTGQIFGRLTVICFAETNNGQRRWLCRCACGAMPIVARQELRKGDTHSCGCSRIESARSTGRQNTQHGEARDQANSAEYRSWVEMRRRCTNPKCIGFKDYGDRGIRVCERWDSFVSFLADMGRKPSSRHSIDRLDNDGNYEPDNCRWATPKEQANNRRKGRAPLFDSGAGAQ